MLKLFSQFDIRTVVTKNTILVRFNSPHSEDLFALSGDAILEMVQKSIVHHHQLKSSKKKETVVVEENSSSNHKWSLEFFQYIDTQERWYRNKGPDMIAGVEMENLKKIGNTVPLDPEFFQIYNILGSSFFAPTSTAIYTTTMDQEEEEEEKKLKEFWRWDIDQQMNAFLRIFGDSPWVCSVLLMSLIGKTLSQVHAQVKVPLVQKQQGGEEENIKSGSEMNVPAYELYKIHGPLLVLFGMSGSATFIKESLIKMMDLVYSNSHSIQLILLPERKEVVLPDWFEEEWRIVSTFPSIHDVKNSSSSVWKLYTRLPLPDEGGGSRAIEVQMSSFSVPRMTMQIPPPNVR
jgi:hypothetical protein